MRKEEMPSPPSAATRDIIEKLKAGVPPSELAKQYAPSMVYRHWHKLEEGGRGSAATNPPPPPGAATGSQGGNSTYDQFPTGTPAKVPQGHTEKAKEQAPPSAPVERPPSAKGELVRTPPPKGSHKIVTPGGGSILVTDSITPLAQAIFMEPRVLKMSMPVYLQPAYTHCNDRMGMEEGHAGGRFHRYSAQDVL